MVAVTSERTRNVLVADSFPLTRGALADLLRSARVADSTFEASSSGSALRQAREHAVDLVILDPDLGRPQAGLRLCLELKSSARPPAVLMYAANSSPSVVTASVANGADGFVHRSATPEQVVQAARSVDVGRSFWFLGELAQAWSAARPTAHEMTGPFNDMTGREQQIFTLLLDRHSNDEIAAELHLATQTVKNHVSTILKKIGAANRRELLMLCRFRGRGTDSQQVTEGAW
jgi:DNA-binding NarL/FixJ family response regulator